MLTVDFDRFPIMPGERVLDLGAGAGRHSFALLRKGADVVALEIATRREGLEGAGHLRPGPPPTGVHVTTTWHLRLIAVVTALGVIAVVGALLA